MEFPENIMLIAGFTVLSVPYVVGFGVHPHSVEMPFLLKGR
jgi:hypothetical protein